MGAGGEKGTVPVLLRGLRKKETVPGGFRNKFQVDSGKRGASMQCRACWSDRVSASRGPRWKVWLAACLLSTPVLCRHCFYEFFVPFWMGGAADAPQPIEQGSQSTPAAAQPLRRAA